MHCIVATRSVTPWCFTLLLCAVDHAWAEPNANPAPASPAAPPVETRTIDPASESDRAVTGEPGRGDSVVSEMKDAGVGVVEMLREMVSSGYAPADIAAGLRIYGLDTPDAVAATLRGAGMHPIQIASFLREGLHVSNAVIVSALSKLGLSQRDIVSVLRAGRVEAKDTVLALHARGALWSEIVQALASAGERPGQIAVALKSAGLPSAQVIASLRSLAIHQRTLAYALTQAGMSAQDLAREQQADGDTFEAIARRLLELGFTLEAVTELRHSRKPV